MIKEERLGLHKRAKAALASPQENRK
jgi:hypothetical protein